MQPAYHFGIDARIQIGACPVICPSAQNCGCPGPPEPLAQAMFCMGTALTAVPQEPHRQRALAPKGSRRVVKRMNATAQASRQSPRLRSFLRSGQQNGCYLLSATNAHASSTCVQVVRTLLQRQPVCLHSIAHRSGRGSFGRQERPTWSSERPRCDQGSFAPPLRAMAPPEL